MANLPMVMFFAVACSTALALSSVTSASAQTEDAERATAREAARSGIVAVLDGRYAEGIALLERAESMVHAPTHLLYLARAYDALGKLVRSRETYLLLAREELERGAPKAFRDAQAKGRAELAKLEPRISSTTIRVEGVDASRVIVSEDGVPLPPGLVGIERPADPGRHAYAASAEGYTLAEQAVTLEPGGAATVVLSLRPMPRRPREVPKRQSADGTATGSEGSGHGGLRAAAWVSLGLGAAAAGVGTYFLARAVDHQAGSNDTFDRCHRHGCTTDERAWITSQDDLAARERRAAVASYVGGGVAVAAGVGLLLLLPHRERETASVRPWLGLKSAGISGTF